MPPVQVEGTLEESVLTDYMDNYPVTVDQVHS